MIYRKLFSSLVFLIFLCIFCITPPDTLSYGSDNNFAQKKVYNYRLDNGLTVLIQEDPSHPLIAISVIVKTGSLYEGQWQGSGIAHLVEHMLFKGSAKYPAGKIFPEVNALGGEINGYTSYQLTGFSLIVPERNFEPGMDILSDMLKNPLFDEQELEKEKEVILNEIRLNRDDPIRYLHRLFYELSYSIAPYKLPVIGLEPLFVRLSGQDLSEFYQKWYIPNNSIISIVGDIAPEEALAKVKEKFGGLKMKAFPQITLPRVPGLVCAKQHAEQKDINAAYMLVGLQSVDLSHPDAPVLDVIANILGSGKSSRFYLNLVKKKRLLDSIECFNHTPNFKGIFAINSILDKKNTDRVVDLIFEELELLKRRPVTKEEIERAINLYLSDFVFSQEGFDARAQTLAQDEAYGQDPHFSRKYLEKISRVTAADIRRCAIKYFNRQNYVRVVLEPKSQTKERPVLPAPKLSPVKKIILDNGVTVILKEDKNTPILSVHAVFGGGVRYENTASNGIFNLLSQMLTRGTSRYRAEKIDKILEKTGASIASFSGYNSFGLSLNVLAKNAQTGIELLCDLVTSPLFSESELELQKQLILKAQKQETDNIFRDTVNLLKKNLFSAAAYRLNPLGVKETVGSFTRKDLTEFYSSFCLAENLVISVCGDFDENIVLGLIKSKFSNFSKNKLPQHVLGLEPPILKAGLVENYRDKEQAIIMIGYRGVKIDSEDRYKLELLNNLLCSSGGILHEEIREKFGLSYAVGGTNISGPDGGYFFVYIATSPEGVDETRKIVRKKIEELQLNGIDDKLLNQVKSYMIGSHRIGLQTNSAIGLTCALDELYGLGFDHYSYYEERINSLDKDDLLITAKKYLDFNRSVTVISQKFK
ncbi:MAG: pitrilysin family protein [Candidatus Omnitrophota bacterium]